MENKWKEKFNTLKDENEKLMKNLDGKDLAINDVINENNTKIESLKKEVIIN